MTILERSFCVLPGIGRTTERRLWQQGLSHWSEFMDQATIPKLGLKRKARCNELLAEAIARFRQGDARYFGVTLPAAEHWRLYEAFRDRAVYVDIETNTFGQITVVGLYGKGRYQAFVRGQSLDAVDLAKALATYDLILTFNGSSFDLPMLLSAFPDLPLDHPHIDLCHVGRRLGYRGGLKVVEQMLGIRRPAELRGVDGSHAMLWWNRWQHRRDEEALQLLLAYNEADCVNLQPLADRFYCELAQQLFLGI